MKNVSANIRTIAIALVALFTVSFTSTAFAGNDPENPAVELKFIGNLNSQPVYQLNVNNLADAEYTIIIKDQMGEVLYSERAKGSNISRKFMLNTSEVNEDDLRFEIINRKSNQTTVYEINKSTKVIQDVVVNKVK